MAQFELEEDPFVAEEATEILSLPRTSSNLDEWRAELGAYFAEMQKFEGMPPEEVFLRLSAFSARASEIRFQITQNESRRYQSFRTQGVDPFIEECDRQFRIHSRIQSTREMEFRISGGAT